MTPGSPPNIQANVDYTAPPENLLWRGAAGDFEQQAKKWHETFRRHADISPTTRVLEIGCGSGRMAVPFKNFFSAGFYVGIDISREAVDWAQRHLGDDKLSFQHIDIANEWYRPNQGTSVVEARLPFADSSFDFIYLTSVFSHLRAYEAAAYLKEISRLLAPSGVAFSTWFLLDDFSRTNIRRDLARFSFKHKTSESTWDEDLARIGKATAIESIAALSFHHFNGLTTELVRGAWSFHPGIRSSKVDVKEFPPFRHSQDIIVGRKRE